MDGSLFRKGEQNSFACSQKLLRSCFTPKASSAFHNDMLEFHLLKHQPSCGTTLGLSTWVCAINYDLKATNLGPLLMKDGADGIDVISQTLSGKATSAILKRVRVFARMIQWSTDNG